HNPVALVQHRLDQANHGADFLHPPARIVDRFVALRIADRLEFGGRGFELTQHDSTDLARDGLVALQAKGHAPSPFPWSPRESANLEQPGRAEGDERPDSGGERTDGDLGQYGTYRNHPGGEEQRDREPTR